MSKPRRRRTSGASTYRRTSDGLWCVVLMVNGKGKVFTAKREADAIAKWEAAKASVITGRPVISGRGKTCEEYFEQWLTARKNEIDISLSPAQWDKYNQDLHNHVIPAIGKIYLNSLTADDLWSLYADRRKVLGDYSVRNIHATIRKALNDAVRNPHEALTINPTTTMKLKVRAKPEQPFLSVPETIEFLRVIRQDRDYGLWVLWATSGMRLSEGLGLLWENVQWGRGSVLVSQGLRRTTSRGLRLQPVKRDTSFHEVVLPPFAMEALRLHRVRQAKEQLEAQPWDDSLDLVFPNSVGNKQEASNFYRHLDSVLRKAGLPKLRPHKLRHSLRANLDAAGISTTAIADRLGHSVATSIKDYSHTTPGMRADAAAMIEQLLNPDDGSEATVIATVGPSDPG